jgi:hypothetical protein
VAQACLPTLDQVTSGISGDGITGIMYFTDPMSICCIDHEEARRTRACCRCMPVDCCALVRTKFEPHQGWQHLHKMLWPDLPVPPFLVRLACINWEMRGFLHLNPVFAAMLHCRLRFAGHMQLKHNHEKSREREREKQSERERETERQRERERERERRTSTLPNQKPQPQT